jgi:hypothetical protein
MTFSNTTDKNGLIQECEMALELGDAAISGNTTLLKQFTNLINQSRRSRELDIIRVQGNYSWDDFNYADASGFAKGTGNLSLTNRDYKLPAADGSGTLSSFLRLHKISVLDSSGIERELEPTLQTEAELNQLYPTAGLPRVYKRIGMQVKVWPLPSATHVTESSGWIVYYQRIGKDFTSSDTTAEPGFAAPFHRLLALDACLDYAGPRKGMEHKLPWLTAKIKELSDKMLDFYSKQDDTKTGLMGAEKHNFH